MSAGYFFLESVTHPRPRTMKDRKNPSGIHVTGKTEVTLPAMIEPAALARPTAAM